MNEMENVPESERENSRLTSWDNEPDVRDLKKDLQQAQTDHQTQVSKIEEYLDNLYVRGSAKVNAKKGRSQIVPKLIRKQAEWRYAALSEPFLSTDDMFKAHPVTWQDKEGAYQNQLVLNAQFNFDLNKVKLVDEYVRTAVDEGTAILRVGWDFQEEEYTTQEPIVSYYVNAEYAQVHQELAQLRESDPNGYYQQVSEELQEAHEMSMEQGRPIEPVVEGYEEVTATRTIVNKPTVDVCNSRNVIIDPTCEGDINKASFVIHSFESSMSELEKDGKYSNLDKINLNEHNSPLSEPDYASENESSFSFSDQARKRLVVHEYWGYWDIDSSGVVKPIVAAWVGNTLIRMEENPFPDKALPFVIVQYLPVRKNIYGEPDGALLEDNQKIMGATLRGMIDIMGRSANGQQGMRKDALDAVNKRRWRNGEDYEFNVNVDPRQAMHMHTFPEIPTSAQFMMQSQNMEAESLTGVKAYSQGVSGESLGEVAASVRGALDAASKRELGILRRLSDGLTEVGRKIMAMNSEFLEDEEVVRITDDEFVEINKDKLAGHYDLKLDIATAEEDDNKARELSFMLQTMGNNMDPKLSQTILADIARLRKMPALAKQLQDYEPQPDPHEQRIKELEAQKLQWEIQEVRSKTIENLAEAGVDRAKAANIESDTDLKSLDFVEQESGVKQERDLESIRTQSEAQTEMKREEFRLNELAEDNNSVRDQLISANE